MSEHDWDVKCKAMFLGLYGAVKLARACGLEPHAMLAILIDLLAANAMEPRKERDERTDWPHPENRT